MIRAALAALALSGCVQILPTLDKQDQPTGCCIAYWEISRSTSGSIEVQKSPTHWSISTKFRTKF